MRTVIAAFFVVHGLIHLLGFFKTWGLAELPQMTGQTLFSLPPSLGRGVGVLWLLACLLLAAAGGMLLVRQGGAWVLGAVGVALSQLLVVYAWPDAKAGTLPNLLLGAVLALGCADAGFERGTARLAGSLLSAVPAGQGPSVTETDLAPLPAVVRRWLGAAGIVGKPRVRCVRLRQRGFLRMAPDKGWMPTRAEQYFTVEEPGFVWNARVHMMGVIPIAGRDSFVGGRGHMLIEALSVVPVVDAGGEKIDQSALLRFLGEMAWFPSAALAPYITWEGVDSASAKATMSYHGVAASAVFSFRDDGRLREMSAERYMGAGPDATLEHWVVPMSEWRELSGVWMPVRGDVVWRLVGGDFNYFRWEITEVQYDQRTPYAP